MTVLVSIGLVVIDVVTPTAFPWAVFHVVGMAAGVWLHWFLAVRRASDNYHRSGFGVGLGRVALDEHADGGLEGPPAALVVTDHAGGI